MKGLLALLVLLATLGQTTTALAASLADILERGTLNACVSPINAGLVQVPDTACEGHCRATGLLVDQVDSFARSLPGEITVDLTIVGWSEQFANADGHVAIDDEYDPARLADGTCDIFISNLARLPWRETKMTIVPLFESRMIVMAPARRAADFTGLLSLGGQAASVQRESAFHTWILDQNRTTFATNPIWIWYSEFFAPFEMVASGVADFTITDADIAVLEMRERPDDFVPVFAVGNVQQLGWGVARSAGDLQNAIAAFFRAQRVDPDSDLNRAWKDQLGVTILEFEALVRALPNAAPGGHPNGG